MLAICNTRVLFHIAPLRCLHMHDVFGQRHLTTETCCKVWTHETHCSCTRHIPRRMPRPCPCTTGVMKSRTDHLSTVTHAAKAAKGHCRNALCNSSIAVMMQQREHCGNALQYCGNICCGNVEGHCKQHQHCGNIAAIRALKQVLRQCADALQQYGHCRNALRHCCNTLLRQCDAALLQHCSNATFVAGVASCSP